MPLANLENGSAVVIAGFCGSLREQSYSRLALQIALNAAAGQHAQTDLIDLRGRNLAFCTGETGTEYPEDVYRLRDQVKAAQGIILATPVYHGSFSGVLKNALDLLGFAEMEGKILGLIGVAAGSTGAAEALAHLRSIGRTLHAWVVPEQVSIPLVDKLFAHPQSEDYLRIEQRLQRVGQQVARFARLHHSREAKDFMRYWEEAPENPGGTK
jgi:FMN reductase